MLLLLDWFCWGFGLFEEFWAGGFEDGLLEDGLFPDCGCWALLFPVNRLPPSAGLF